MSKLMKFQDDVKSIRSESRKDMAKLIRDLKRLSPEELLRLGPSIWSQVSFSAFREIIKVVAPEIKIVAPRKTLLTSMPRLGWLQRIRARFSRWQRAGLFVIMSSAACVASVLLVIPTAFYLIAPIGLKRTEDASSWPLCRRLSHHVDGCVYVPQRAMDLTEVVSVTGVSLQVLSRANRHLSSSTVSPGDVVVIWRERGTLVGSEK